MKLRSLRRPHYSLPGDTLVSDVIDGPQRVRAHGAVNRADNRRILFRERPRNPQAAWDDAIRRLKLERGDDP